MKTLKRLWLLLSVAVLCSSCSKCDFPIYEAGHSPARCQLCHSHWDFKMYDNKTEKPCETP